MKPRGLYESFLTQALADILQQLPDDLHVIKEQLRAADAISRERVHWESQNATMAESETGQRCQHHERMGTSIMLFARLRADERAFWFLGPATYVKHDGEAPMAITWRLRHSLPGDLFEQFAAAVA